MRTLIVVPTFEEATNVEPFLAAIRDAVPAADILIVDDNSPDGTADLAEKAGAELGQVKVLRRPKKDGLGNAYRAGFGVGMDEGYETLVQMDVDFSHDPSHLKQFLNAIETNDLVLGSRYQQGRVTVVNWPISRLILSYSANLYARAVTGLPVWDATGGFKCFRRSVLEAIDLSQVRSNGYAFQIEMSFRAWKRGFRIAEIPIVFVDRTEGTSKMSRSIVREAIWMVWRLRWWAIRGTI